jgi:hypothetical protein
MLEHTCAINIPKTKAIFVYATLSYGSLLQRRGAIHFRSSILQRSSSKNSRLSPSDVLDALQGWMAPVIALTLWSLFSAGVYSRGSYIFIIIVAVGLFGIRSFVTIVNQRVSTLKRIAPIVNAKHGSRAALNRRQGFLKKRSLSLILDLTVVWIGTVLAPCSLLFLGYPVNSYRYAVVVFAVNVVNVACLVGTGVLLFVKLREAKRVQSNRTRTHLSASKEGRSHFASAAALSSNPGVMSALEPSQVFHIKDTTHTLES